MKLFAASIFAMLPLLIAYAATVPSNPSALRIFLAALAVFAQALLLAGVATVSRSFGRDETLKSKMVDEVVKEEVARLAKRATKN